VTASRDQIENLIHTYAERMDAGDFAGVGELFAEGAILGPDGTRLAEGREAVRQLYERTTRRHEDGTPRTRHVTSNLILEVDEAAGTAAGRCTYLVLQATPTLGLQPIVSGRYQDRFERRAGSWCFHRRRMFVDLTGELGEHLTIDLPRS
jgi:3-phenylpropionate/cinnamic acid dioxygenase small subunit